VSDVTHEEGGLPPHPLSDVAPPAGGGGAADPVPRHVVINIPVNVPSPRPAPRHAGHREVMGNGKPVPFRALAINWEFSLMSGRSSPCTDSYASPPNMEIMGTKISRSNVATGCQGQFMLKYIR